MNFPQSLDSAAGSICRHIMRSNYTSYGMRIYMGLVRSRSMRLFPVEAFTWACLSQSLRRDLISFSFVYRWFVIDSSTCVLRAQFFWSSQVDWNIRILALLVTFSQEFSPYFRIFLIHTGRSLRKSKAFPFFFQKWQWKICFRFSTKPQTHSGNEYIKKCSVDVIRLSKNKGTWGRHAKPHFFCNPERKYSFKKAKKAMYRSRSELTAYYHSNCFFASTLTTYRRWGRVRYRSTRCSAFWS